MERLTEQHYKKTNGFYMKCSGHCCKENFSCEDCKEFEKLIDRLGASEDILGDEYALDHLRELAQADKEGRCVVLPCKIGDKMYDIILGELREKSVISLSMLLSKSVNHLVVHAENFRNAVTSYELQDIGKTVFTTRDEAEKALEGAGC